MKSRMLTAPRLIAAAFASALALLIVSAPAAQAGLLVDSAPNCDAQAISNPFAPWLDPMDYEFGPDGGFEAGGVGWDLDGAALSNDNESHYVHDSADTKSLVVGAGDVATTPTVCVGLEHPTIRFFTRKASGLLATMTVEVLFESSLGATLSAPIGVVAPNGRWQPSIPMPVAANLLPLLPGDHTPVRFRFRTLAGSIAIDDLYVDPRRNS
jgi:hypothetical protein